MTCEELRKHVEENNPLEDAEFWSATQVAAHIATCATCSQFVQKRQSLWKGLQLFRESVGSVPESLDAAILAGYHRFVAEQEETHRLSVRKAYFPLFLRWGVVAALGLTVAAIALFLARKPNKTMVAPSPVPPATAIADVIPQTPTARPQVRVGRRVIPPIRKHSVSPEVRSVVRAIAPIPDDFRGLMYCDELSCGVAMDMIRVQLPSSVIAMPRSAFRSISGPVNADVLIGPDGIARGIRIEEREF